MALIATNGAELFHEVTGEGFPLVFSHEFGGDFRSWEPQVRFFSRLYRCVTYNHRGFPPSGVPREQDAYSQEIFIEDLRGLLDGLGIEQAHMVGLSLGANVVLNFALRHPERCRSIVVAGCGSGSTNRDAWEGRMADYSRILMEQGVEQFAAVLAMNANRTTFRRKDPRGWEQFRAQLGEHSPLGSALTIQGVMLGRPTIFALKERLNRLQVPALIVVGDEDEPCIEPGLFMRREIPTAGLLFLPRSGHVVNLEEPDLFNQAVARFLHEVEAGR